MNKKILDNLSKFPLIINLLSVILILYDVLVLFKKGKGDVLGEPYLFAIYFLIIIYGACFIHLFYYHKIKEKIKYALLDTLPLIFFIFATNVVEEHALRDFVNDFTISILRFYVLGTFIVLLINYSIHKIYLIITGLIKSSKK
ncbi:MAG TPA: hypothetical protein VI564_07525 [Candidatus Nanoarchaeia archaeon]|nr:hypothetical protein [Candidatus Nanoarchaeia archaeon]